MSKMFSINFICMLCFINTLMLFAQGTWQSEIIYYDNDGKLKYISDEEGNRIPDFSFAGYKNGEADIPNVETVKTISPVPGDNTLHIQTAIDEVGQLPLNQNGFRGALLLTAGIYRVSGTIYLKYDGVILRGVGDSSDSTLSTIIYGVGNTPHHRTIIIAGGGKNTQWSEQVTNTKTNITTSKVYIGSDSFEVENTTAFSPGDNIIIYHPMSLGWISAVGGGGTDTDRNWVLSDNINIIYNRYIKSIDGNKITVDAPIYNTFDKSISQSYIYKYSREGLRTNIGIENLRIDIEAEGSTTDQNGNEEHAWHAIDLLQLEDTWVKNCTMLHFGQSGIRLSTATRVTIDSCKALEPISIITGERRYNFNLSAASQFILVKNCLSTYSRHDFVSNGTSSVSGCVFYNNESMYAYASSEGHRFWSQGLLFDNIKFTSPNTNIVLGLYSRGNYGTSHGWAAAHSVAWNCSAPSGSKIIIQKPPTAQNYAIGCGIDVTGLKSQGAPFDYPEGYIEGINEIGLLPNSLYLTQLQERQNLGEASLAPSELNVKVLSSRKLLLSWKDNSYNETTFRIERSIDKSITWEELNTVGENITSYIDTGLTAAAEYYYRIRSSNFYGNSEYSNQAKATTTNSFPIEAPSNLSVIKTTFNKIELSWIDNSNNEDKFIIERSLDNTIWLKISEADIDINSYEDNYLNEGTEYLYRVQAENFYGVSDYSNIIAAATLQRETGSNLALYADVTFSSEQIENDNYNPALNAVDGDVNTRWSSARDKTWPQWLEVDLGSVKKFNKTELICYNDRAYQFIIEAKSEQNEPYKILVDRSNNSAPGSAVSPITDVFEEVNARFVRITVTGDHNYAGPWTSIAEFRIFYNDENVGININNSLPSEFMLFQNFPNPFNPLTTIQFTIPEAADSFDKTILKIYDALGSEILTMINQKINSGSYKIDFDASKLSSGVYFYRLQSGNYSSTKKMIILK